MANRGQPPYRIVRLDQLKVLESPVRIEVLFGFVASGPCSIAQVARELGRSPESLYYHVRKLERVGLLHSVGEQDTGARTEELFDTPGRALVLPFQSQDEQKRKIIVKLTQSSLRLAARELEDALLAPDAVFDGPRRTAHGGRDKAWLSAAELKEANHLIDRLHTLFRQARHAPHKRLFSLTVALAHGEARHSPRDTRDA